MVEGLQTTLGGIGEDVETFVTEKPLATAAIGAGIVAAGAGVALVAASGKKNKKKTTKRGRKRDRIFKSKQKHERRYKRKKKYKVYGKKGYIKPKKSNSKRRGKVYYAKKTGQPYILLSSGKAKFIKGKRRKK